MRNDVTYAALGRAIQDGGLLVAVSARYTIFPTHGSAALFAACGMPLWVFFVSIVLSLPKSLVNVYIGSTFKAEEQGHGTTVRELVKYLMLALTMVVTVVAMLYIDSTLNNKHKPHIVYERRKAR